MLPFDGLLFDEGCQWFSLQYQVEAFPYQQKLRVPLEQALYIPAFPLFLPSLRCAGRVFEGQALPHSPHTHWEMGSGSLERLL